MEGDCDRSDIAILLWAALWPTIQEIWVRSLCLIFCSTHVFAKSKICCKPHFTNSHTAEQCCKFSPILSLLLTLFSYLLAHSITQSPSHGCCSWRSSWSAFECCLYFTLGCWFFICQSCGAKRLSCIETCLTRVLFFAAICRDASGHANRHFPQNTIQILNTKHCAHLLGPTLLWPVIELTISNRTSLCYSHKRKKKDMLPNELSKRMNKLKYVARLEVVSHLALLLCQVGKEQSKYHVAKSVCPHVKRRICPL